MAQRENRLTQSLQKEIRLKKKVLDLVALEMGPSIPNPPLS